jgi:hypothetical protein
MLLFCKDHTIGMPELVNILDSTPGVITVGAITSATMVMFNLGVAVVAIFRLPLWILRISIDVEFVGMIWPGNARERALYVLFWCANTHSTPLLVSFGAKIVWYGSPCPRHSPDCDFSIQVLCERAESNRLIC